MKRKPFWGFLTLFMAFLTLSLLCLGGCTSSSSQTQSDFYNAGNGNLSVTELSSTNILYSVLILPL